MGLVKGISITNLHSFALERFGSAGWEAVLSAVPPADRTVLATAVASEWYDLAILARARHALDAELGAGDLQLVEALGRYDCNKDLSTVTRWFFRVIPPDFAVRHIDMYWRRFHDSGHWTSEQRRRDIVAHLAGWAVVDEGLCRHLVGYLRGTLEVIRNRDLLLHHPRCRARGHQSCEFVWRWQPAAITSDAGPLSARDLGAIGRELVQITDLDLLGKAVVEVLVGPLGCRRVALWKVCSAGGAERLLCSSTPDGSGERQRFVLETRGRTVGRLEVEVTPGPEEQMLEALLPWLAMALAGAHDPSDELSRRVAGAADRWGLTPRQTEVLGLIARGFANKDIAAEFQRHEGTVEIHVSQILKKAGAENRTALIAQLWAAC